MATIKCGECPLRKKYDEKPKSLAGRFWRWHIKFCPKWKIYLKSLNSEQKELIAEKYNIKTNY
ncbi:MAG: hypothetical protein N4A72_21910 [Bacteroidales bacterium]|jgi:hypothetical protein|nr:hypothetical protein [Bacteroidales bacterium]